MSATEAHAAQAGSLAVAGKVVPRLGFGAMQLPKAAANDRTEAVRAVRRAVELGVRFIDTSGYYGPDIANEVIAEAVHPYPDDLVIASKVGARRAGNSFVAADTADEISRAVEHDLTVLRLETLDLVHARRMPDSTTPYVEMIAALDRLRERGLVRHIGVSNVDQQLLDAAQRIAPIASIENEFNIAQTTNDQLVSAAESGGLAFLPFHPLALGSLAEADSPLAKTAADLGATPAQLAIAWLLHRSPAILPIPGTSSARHVEDNIAAAALQLAHTRWEALTADVTVSTPSG